MSTFFAPPGHNQDHIVVFAVDNTNVHMTCRCGWHDRAPRLSGQIPKEVWKFAALSAKHHFELAVGRASV